MRRRLLGLLAIVATGACRAPSHGEAERRVPGGDAGGAPSAHVERVLAAIASRSEAAVRSATLAGERASSPLAKSLSASVLEAERRALADLRDLAKRDHLDIDAPLAEDPVLLADLAALGDRTARLARLSGAGFDAAYFEDARAGFSSVARLAEVGRRASPTPPVGALLDRLAGEARGFADRAVAAAPRGCGGDLAVSPEPGGATSPSAPAPEAAPAASGPAVPLAPGAPPDGRGPPRPDAGARRP